MKIYPVYHHTYGFLNMACGDLGMYTSIEDPQVGEILCAKYFF